MTRTAIAACAGAWLCFGLGVALSAVLPLQRPGAATPKLIPVRITSARTWAAGAVVGWQEAIFDDRTWTPATGMIVPHAGLLPGAPIPPGVAAIDVAPGMSLFLRSRFDVESPPAARVLELRVTYLDGFVAFVNGVEVARRNVPSHPDGARPTAIHDREPERIFLPLSERKSALLRPRGNVLAVEIRPASVRAPVDVNAPAGQVGLALFSGVRIVRGPYLIDPSDGSASVAWETDLPARGMVELQPDDGGNIDGASVRRLPAQLPALRQVVRLGALLPGRRYRYQVTVDGVGAGDRAQSVPASFRSAPERDQPVRFVVYGDMRAPGHAAHAQVVAGILREQIPLVINTGDLVAIGAHEGDWQRYFEITAPLGATAAVVPALGNHDSYLGGFAKSWTLFGLKAAGPDPSSGYMSFDWAGVHVVILDSGRPDKRQRDWMQRDLEKAQKDGARAIFAVCHDGPWSHGPHGGSKTMEREFAPAMAAGGVDVLFSGHEHLYERGTGMTPHGPLSYVVTGGGGAPLYNPTCVPVKGTASAGALAPAVSHASLSSSSLPVCSSTVTVIQKVHHFVVVEVNDHSLRLCPHLPDGGLVEPCVDFPLRARRQ